MTEKALIDSAVLNFLARFSVRDRSYASFIWSALVQRYSMPILDGSDTRFRWNFVMKSEYHGIAENRVPTFPISYSSVSSPDHHLVLLHLSWLRT